MRAGAAAAFRRTGSAGSAERTRRLPGGARQLRRSRSRGKKSRGRCSELRLTKLTFARGQKAPRRQRAAPAGPPRGCERRAGGERRGSRCARRSLLLWLFYICFPFCFVFFFFFFLFFLFVSPPLYFYSFSPPFFFLLSFHFSVFFPSFSIYSFFFSDLFLFLFLFSVSFYLFTCYPPPSFSYFFFFLFFYNKDKRCSEPSLLPSRSMPAAAASLLQSCAAGISFRDAAWGCSAVGTVFGVEKIWGSRSPAPRRSKGDAVPAQTPTALFARLRGGGTPALRSAAASLGAKSWAGGHCSQRSSLSP